MLTFNYSSNSSDTRWGNVVIYIDWNRDGEFSTSSEKYDIYGGADGRGQSGYRYSNETYQIQVPMSAYAGFSAIRIISEEAMQHNSVNNFDPCGARHKGSVHTFGLRIIDPTVENEMITTDNVIRIYPNPVRSSLFVESNINDKIELLTLNGIVVKTITVSDQQTIINVNDLQKGVYLLRVKNDNEVDYFTICKY